MYFKKFKIKIGGQDYRAPYRLKVFWQNFLAILANSALLAFSDLGKINEKNCGRSK
jgi:hypothetical protein